MSRFAFPYGTDASGRTGAPPDDDAYVRDLIEQVLFTAPGERPNRPDFGTGVHQLVFAPASDELASATQFMVQSALQQWLGNVVRVERVGVSAVENVLHVDVAYVRLRTGERRQVALTGEV